MKVAWLGLLLAAGCGLIDPGHSPDAPPPPGKPEAAPLFLVAGPSWTLTGNTSENIGDYLAGGADIDGDGFSDFVVAGSDAFISTSLQGQAKTYLGGLGDPTLDETLSPQAVAGTRNGNTVAMLGDIDGDGFGDVAIGALRGEQAGQDGFSDEGLVFIYRGTADGIDVGSAVPIAPIAQSNSLCGKVGAAGDVNGDGLADVVVGCPGYDGEASDEGLAAVFLGTPTGISTTPHWTLDPVDIQDAEFGFSVAGAGDINGDGLGDVIIGATGYTNNVPITEGRAYIVLGDTAGAGTISFVDPTEDDGSQFGWSVSGAGDVDADGFADVLIGAPNLFGDGGVYVFHGSAAGLEPTPRRTLEPTSSSIPMVGHSVAGLGDLNDDGYADIGLGAPGFGTGNQGQAYFYSGSAAGIEANPARVLPSSSGMLGSAVARAGDTNGDGLDDAIVGARLFSSDNGQVFLHRGEVVLGGGPEPQLIDQAQDGSGLGASVAYPGDVNGDGFDDVVVGAPTRQVAGVDQHGQAFLYLGAAGATVPDAGIPLGRVSDQAAFIGLAVAGGDINGDGLDDVVIGAPGIGGVDVYYGSTSGMGGGPDLQIDPLDGAAGAFGFSVAVVDIDLDGFAEVLVGAPSRAGTAGGEGAVLIYQGSEDGVDATAARTLEPADQDGALFGASVAGISDVNGDGFIDVAVGAPGDGPVSGEGKLYVYYGEAGGLAAAPGFTVDPTDTAGAQFARAVAGIGDVDRDGFDDLLVGAPKMATAPGAGGTATLYYGRAAGLSDTASDNLNHSPADGDEVGASISAIGDFNGDLFPDYAVGVPAAGDILRVTPNAGTALNVTVVVGSPGSRTGAALAGPGDFNGDGFADLVVGAPGNDGLLKIIYGGDSRVGADRQLRQLDYDESPLAIGNRATGDLIILRARGTQLSPGGGLLQIEFEIKPWREAFDGLGVTRSDPFIGGGVGEIRLSGLGDEPYKWRARSVYPAGLGFSRWIEYGVGNSSYDLISNSAPVPEDCVGPECTDAGPDPDPTGRGQRSLYGCQVGGQSSGGLWLLLLLAAVFVRRRSAA